MKKIIALSMTVVILLSACASQTGAEYKKNNISEDTKMTYHMPAEDLPHEGTWLIWPHQYTYGAQYQKDIQSIWI